MIIFGLKDTSKLNSVLDIKTDVFEIITTYMYINDYVKSLSNFSIRMDYESNLLVMRVSATDESGRDIVDLLENKLVEYFEIYKSNTNLKYAEYTVK